MINAEMLKMAGVDYQAGLARFMNDAELYEAVLMAYAGQDVLERAQEAFQNGDKEMLLAAVHEAKGSSGNADLMAVYVEASALVALLRGNSYTEDELADGFQRFESAYIKIKNAIQAALAG